MMLVNPFPHLKSKEIKQVKKDAKEDIKAAESARNLLLLQSPELIQQAIER
jgi:hypothetical protein